MVTPIGQIAPASRMAGDPQPTRLDTLHAGARPAQHPPLGRWRRHRRQSLGVLSRLQAEAFAPPAATVALRAPNNDFLSTPFFKESALPSGPGPAPGFEAMAPSAMTKRERALPP